eukprot:CAMPEP_0115376956 /NCGR_PEP_ID=MMETSP0271-20121206/3242_1 /TAXON_ID=71861 /ORGANISM="Scrippsiella trochoidea, Strain CCMP3099" /LENGTH=77 /DNA_ID=CAMNT_0002800061 /DNA_START=635 /DNA_END=868 /DNA_ORIENTATION=+
MIRLTSSTRETAWPQTKATPTREVKKRRLKGRSVHLRGASYGLSSKGSAMRSQSISLQVDDTSELSASSCITQAPRP